MNTKTHVAFTGILAILPALTLLTAFSVSGPFGRIPEFMVLLTTLVVGLVFTTHAFTKTTLSTETKVMWTIAMFLFFPFVSQLIYWARNICYAEYQHARFQKMYA